MGSKKIVEISEYWSRKNSDNFRAIIEKCIDATAPRGKTVTAFTNMVAIGPDKEHFCWFHYLGGRVDADCIIEPMIYDLHIREATKLLDNAGIRWKFNRTRVGGRSIRFWVNIEQVNDKYTWSNIERILRSSAFVA